MSSSDRNGGKECTLCALRVPLAAWRPRTGPVQQIPGRAQGELIVCGEGGSCCGEADRGVVHGQGAGWRRCCAGTRRPGGHCCALRCKHRETVSWVVQVWRNPAVDFRHNVTRCENARGLRAPPCHITPLVGKRKDALAVQANLGTLNALFVGAKLATAASLPVVLRNVIVTVGRRQAPPKETNLVVCRS